MKNVYTVDSFFAGTGGIDLGLSQTHHFYSIWANEFDKWADQTYHLNFPNAKLTHTDIKKIPTSKIPHADIMVGGFPCQPFSIAGYQKGFKDKRGTLFFEILRAIIAKQPKAILLENVKNLVGHHHGKTFKVIWEALVKNGYYIKWQVMNTKKYGNLPQNRERIYIVGFKNYASYQAFHFPKPIRLTKSIHNIFDFQTKFPDNLIYNKHSYIYPRLTPKIKSSNTVYEYRRGYVRTNKSNMCPAITSICGEGGDNTPIIKNHHGQIRPLTPRECFNAQGFPSNFKLPKQAKSHLLKQAGNAVSIPVIKRIGSQLYKALQVTKPLKNQHDLNKYVLLRLKVQGRFKGQAEIVYTASSKHGLLNKVPKKQVYNTKQYFKAIYSKRPHEFYLIEKR